MITSEWPSKNHPEIVPFLVNEVQALRNAGVTVDVFSFHGKKNPINYLRAWFQMRKDYSLKTYDLIHAEWGQSGLLALPKNKPLVVTFRGSDLEGIVNKRGKYTISGKLLRLVSQFIATIADQIIIVSESQKKLLPSVPYTILSVCLDTSVFRPMPKEIARKQLNLPLEKSLVLFSSNPSRPEKRYSLAKAAVDLLGDDTRIIVTRNVPHDQMVLYYNACDVMVITSSHEGSPTVVFEALACNLPIVSVDVGDVRSRIGKIKGCFISESDTPMEISKCIKSALDDSCRLDSSSQMTEFNCQKFCETMKKIYDDCVTVTNQQKDI